MQSQGGAQEVWWWGRVVHRTHTMYSYLCSASGAVVHEVSRLHTYRKSINTMRPEHANCVSPLYDRLSMYPAVTLHKASSSLSIVRSMTFLSGRLETALFSSRICSCIRPNCR